MFQLRSVYIPIEILTVSRHYLDETDFKHLSEIKCPDETFNSFIILYNLAFEKACPLIKTEANRKYVKIEPWMTSDLITSL